MGKKKKFIDKKKAITFRLVHRSQRDPLITDENAPQHVLQQISDERKDELEKYGIYYDDDYDYLQHLKERSTVAEMIEVSNIAIDKEKKSSKKLAFPSSVFQSELEEKEGMLNKAAPKSGLQLDLDPDVVAAMDEDFDYSDPENILDDDFVLMANATPERSDEEQEVDDDDGEMHFGSDDDDDQFSEEETKSRFTEYSMTSSVIKRNEQLTMLDGRFEEMYSQYDDNEIGALDCEEIEGDIDTQNEMLEKIIKKYESTRLVEPLETERPTLVPTEHSSSDSDSVSSVIEVKEKEKWDCESILSTYSTLYNHPKLIDAPQTTDRIKISGKTGIPITKERLTATTLAKFDENTCEENGVVRNRATGPGSLASAVSYLSIRPKGESSEDRLARKRAFRQHRRERRTERKLNTEAFKEEKKRMEKMMANNKTKFQIPI